MIPYSLVRKALFALPPEVAHRIALAALSLAGHPPIGRTSQPQRITIIKGLPVLNRVGLAAGFDKNAIAVDGISRLGFGFIEIGTVTPKPQPGNPRPRLHRVPEASALINSMGFPNDGAPTIADRIRHRRFRGALGVNIGKNAATDIDSAVGGYVACFETLRDVADYIVVNVSSPNTTGLRLLQEGSRLGEVLAALADRRRGARSPKLLLKIAPDLEDPEIEEIAGQCLRYGFDGVVATNTTLSRDGLPQSAPAYAQGGLSGAPLRSRSLPIVRRLRSCLGPAPLLIGCGGILSPDDACAFVEAGADLVQLYTGLVYRGPALVRDCASALGP